MKLERPTVGFALWETLKIFTAAIREREDARDITILNKKYILKQLEEQG